MNSQYARKVRLFYGVFLSVLTIAVGIIFIVEAAQIYYSDLPYSRELVAERLRLVMIPAILWIVAVVAGYVLSVLFPYTHAAKRRPDEHAALKRLKRRIPQGEGGEFLAEKKRFRKYELARLLAWLAAALFAVAAAIVSIVYLSITAHFAAADPTGEVLIMLRHILPWVGVSFLLFVGATVFEYFIEKRELKSAKQLIVLGKGMPLAAPSPLAIKRDAALAALENAKVIWAVRAVVLVVAVTFIALGIANGGMRDVLIKAINICDECIGLG